MQANNTNSNRGGRGGNGGRGNSGSNGGGGNGSGGRGRGGRGNGSGGRGRGRGNGGRSSRDPNRDPSDPHTDPTDPSVWLNNADFYALSPELRSRRIQRRNDATRGHTQQSQARQANQATSAPAAAPIPAEVPSNSGASVASGVTQPPNFVRQMMSAHQARHPPSQSQTQAGDDIISVNGTLYRRANHTHLYSVHESARHVRGALIDGGANGGLIGSDARILETHLTATANVEGITQNVMENLPIV